MCDSDSDASDGFFLHCLQCLTNMGILIKHVRTINNLLFGISCQEVEEAIGWLNRTSPLPQVT